MVELSVTVTVGEGNEQHNHDLEYRATLQHVHDRENGIVELIPYRPYKDQINEAVKPYIDEYNAKVEARYQAAWERYNAGEINTKPRKRDYKKMGYDYYTEHLEDERYNVHTKKVERVPMFRSMIIGIGDQEDRKAGRITEEVAKRIMKQVAETFREKFPDMLLLGATLHVDEDGFYHIHLDYKPLFRKENVTKGLPIGIGQDAALEHMGYEPEQSIINGRDKVPLRFNAMRNTIYHMMEAAMSEEKLRLQYGVSEIKDPGKDSSKNQALENWQATQDAVRDLQHQKNLVLDTISNGLMNTEDVEDVIVAANDIFDKIEEIENSPHKRFDKSKAVVEFHLLDQLKSFVKHLINIIGRIFSELQTYRDRQADYDKLKSNAEKGRYYSDLDLKVLHADKDRQISALEGALKSTGMSQAQIDIIKSGDQTPGKNREIE